MRLSAVLLLAGLCAPAGWAQQKPANHSVETAPRSVSTNAADPQAKPSGAQPQAQPPAKPEETKPGAPETEQIQAPTATPAPVSLSRATGPGFMEPAQVKDLLHKIWLAEFRVNDLLSQVQPGKWKKMPDPARASFDQTLTTLRQQLQSLEDWRAQFEKRTDSMYLGYQTFIAISAVLPRLSGVAHAISQYENSSFGAQYSKAGDQLFDLQQALQPYLTFMMRNQDELLLAAQTNLASCQNELGFAMRPRIQPAKPMRNIMPELKGRHVRENREKAAELAAKSEKEKKGTESKAKPASTSTQKGDAKGAAKPGAKAEAKSANPPTKK